MSSGGIRNPQYEQPLGYSSSGGDLGLYDQSFGDDFAVLEREMPFPIDETGAYDADDAPMLDTPSPDPEDQQSGCVAFLAQDGLAAAATNSELPTGTHAWTSVHVRGCYGEPPEKRFKASVEVDPETWQSPLRIPASPLPQNPDPQSWMQANVDHAQANPDTALRVSIDVHTKDDQGDERMSDALTNTATTEAPVKVTIHVGRHNTASVEILITGAGEQKVSLTVER